MFEILESLVFINLDQDCCTIADFLEELFCLWFFTWANENGFIHSFIPLELIFMPINREKHFILESVPSFTKVLFGQRLKADFILKYSWLSKYQEFTSKLGKNLSVW